MNDFAYLLFIGYVLLTCTILGLAVVLEWIDERRAARDAAVDEQVLDERLGA